MVAAGPQKLILYRLITKLIHLIGRHKIRHALRQLYSLHFQSRIFFNITKLLCISKKSTNRRNKTVDSSRRLFRSRQPPYAEHKIFSCDRLYFQRRSQKFLKQGQVVTIALHSILRKPSYRPKIQKKFICQLV